MRVTVVIASGNPVPTKIEKPLFPLFWRSESKGKRDRDQNVVQSFKDREISTKILERKAELAVRGEKMAQQNCMKLRQTWRSNMGKIERNSDMALFFFWHSVLRWSTMLCR